MYALKVAAKLGDMSVTDLLYPSTYVRAECNNVKAWYEFLLKPELLPDHLNEADPEPSGCALIKVFFDQVNRPVTEQGQVLPPPDNQRNKTIRNLALQTASLLKWNLNTLEKELPIAARHQLLTEMIKACKTSIPLAPQNALAGALESLHDHSIMSLILYCRWGVRTIVKSTFPCKPGGRVTPTVPQSVPYQANAQQRCDEMREQIIGILKDQVYDIVQLLEAVLHYVKRPVVMPGYHTISSYNLCKNAEKTTGDMLVSCEELHAQICYDLGCLHFTHNYYEKAGEMFGHVREWLRRLPRSMSGFCDIDESTLHGYRVACQMITKTGENTPDDAVAESDRLRLKIQECRAKKGSAIREMLDCILEDIYKKEMATAYLDEIERELLYSGDDTCGSDVLFDVKWAIAVRRAVRGIDQPTNLWTFGMNVAQLQRVIGIVQQVAPYINSEEGERLGSFLCSLANNLSDPSISDQLLQFEVTRRLISEDDLDTLLLRLQAPVGQHKLDEDDSPSSPGSGAEATTSQSAMASLENTLLRSFDAKQIRDALKQLHAGSSGKKFYNLTAAWELSTAYVSAITTSTTDAESYDFFHILLVKAGHCLTDRDYSTAKQLLTHIKKRCTGKSEQKIQKIATNELLKVELIELHNDASLDYADPEECAELRNQLSDVIARCRHLLTTVSDQSKQTNLPTELIELCTSMLINLEDLSFFKNVSRATSAAPCLRFAVLLASLRSGVIDRTLEPRKAAHDLWSAAIGIYATSVPVSGASSGRGGFKKSQNEPLRNLLPNNAIIARPALLAFVKLIRNPNFLQIIVSLLVHLHRLCRTDILSDIVVRGTNVINSLWPASLDGAPLSGACVTLALRETLSYCLTLQPQSTDWLRTQADVHYVFNNYGAALCCYLLLGAYSTNYFNDISSSGPYDDDLVVQRMIKCCMQMKCYTQAAVLCQITKEVDYSTAFKALQENRERTDAAEIYYRDHLWDVQILEHAVFEHRESGENAKKAIAIGVVSRPELNHSNLPGVAMRVKTSKMARFFQAMARQYLC